MKRTVIVSDLHLGLGRLPETGRYDRLEAFFFDCEFADFVDWLIRDCADGPARLVLNGDVIDFLRIDAAPGKRGQLTRVEQRGHKTKRGLGFTEESTLWKTRRVTEAHSTFFEALARWLEAGHEIVWLPGNHDPEVRLEPVQKALRQAVRSACRENPFRVDEALHFFPWFFFEPGRLWVEHGNQTDSENAFVYPMAEEFPDLDCRCFPDELDMPIGSWFQRYVFNGLGTVTFQVPAVSAHRPYAFWLLLNRPHALFKLVRSHAALWRRLVRETCSADHGPALQKMEQSHTDRLKRTAEACSLEFETLDHLSRRTEKPVRPGTVVAAFFRRAARLVGLSTIGLGVTALLLSFAYVAILTSGLGVLIKGILLFLLALVPVGVILGAGVVLWLRGVGPDHRKREAARAHAERVAESTGARVVVLGHYHSEDRSPIRNGTYLNSGTWVTVWDPGDQLRERVQFTFCDVHGRESTLRYWDPRADRPRRVILMEE